MVQTARAWQQWQGGRIICISTYCKEWKYFHNSARSNWSAGRSRKPAMCSLCKAHSLCARQEYTSTTPLLKSEQLSGNFSCSPALYHQPQPRVAVHSGGGGGWNTDWRMQADGVDDCRYRAGRAAPEHHWLLLSAPKLVSTHGVPGSIQLHQDANSQLQPTPFQKCQQSWYLCLSPVLTSLCKKIRWLLIAAATIPVPDTRQARPRWKNN